MQMFKRYGECPNCGAMCQPPDGRDKDNTEFCYCCDCRIMWKIVHTDENDKRETHLNTYEIIDIESFDDSFIPYDCE